MPGSKRHQPTAAAVPTPLRDNRCLYVDPATLQCASESGCIVCSYKVACFDVALDKDFTTVWPNQRPETCPRLSCPVKTSNKDVVDHNETTSTTWPCFRGNKKILTVGDGDFSYSVALSRHLQNGHNLTATSYESKSTLENVYPSDMLQSYFQELQQAGASIRFAIDATQLPQDLQETVWDVVVWNFPCTAIAAGQDGQNQAMEDNKELLRRFCRSVQAQEIHMAHKTKPPYNQWGLVEVVTSSGGNWKYVGRIVLDRALWRPYVPRKALNQKSFPCHDACTYVFQRSTNSSSSSVENPMWLGKALMPVTDEKILELRSTWMSKTPDRKTKKRRAWK